MLKSRIIVTGGAGFIGSHVVDALLRKGHAVTVLDNFSTGKRSNLSQWASDERLEIIECDVADGLFAPLNNLDTSAENIGAVVHLSAQTSVVASLQNPLFDNRANYQSTLCVLEYCRYQKIPRVVHASSAAVYGNATSLPIAERSPTLPLSPYGLHKLASEQALLCYQQIHNISSTRLRFFNVFGPRQDPASPYSGVISVFVDRAKHNQPLCIFGDGKQTRDFVYVGDVADIIVQSCFADSAEGQVFNVGTGSATSILELATKVIQASSSTSTIEHKPKRTGEIVDSLADVGHAENKLGFRATTSLLEGLRHILNE